MSISPGSLSAGSTFCGATSVMVGTNLALQIARQPTVELACERRRTSGCHFSPPREKRQPEIRLRSQATVEPNLAFGAGLAPKKGTIVALTKKAKLAPKIVLYFTHQNGPILRAKTESFESLYCVNSLIIFSSEFLL